MYYCEKISTLKKMKPTDIRTKLSDLNPDSNPGEQDSWEASLPVLIKRVSDAGLDDLYLIAEYELPCGKRIDALLFGLSRSTGKPQLLVIELKQWSFDRVELMSSGPITLIKVDAGDHKYSTIHPHEQSSKYRDLLLRNHSRVIDVSYEVSECEYLFAFESGHKENLYRSGYASLSSDKDKMFCKGEEERFQDYLSSLFSSIAPDKNELNEFLGGTYRLSDIDMEVFKDISTKPDSIELLEDQEPINNIYQKCLNEVLNGSANKYMLLVTGAAGTGKTIVGFKMLSEYCEEIRKRGGVNKCVYSLPRSRTIKAVLDGIGGGLQAAYINNLRGSYDLIVIDEAHRITNFNEIAPALNNAKIVVVLQDDRQRVLGNEIGTKENYKAFAAQNRFTFLPYPLKYQKRAGFGGYVERIDKLLYGGDVKITEKLGMNVLVYDDIRDMENKMNELYADSPKTKYYASYCWKWKSQYDESQTDIEIPDNGYIFRKQWNPMAPDAQFQWYMDSLEKVGCIYTAQGLGFDHVALIWWDDLRWDKTTNSWKVSLDKITPFDYQLKKTTQDKNINYDYLLLNIYRVLLTRAKKTVLIWFKDADTREHFKKIVLGS